MRGAKSVIHIKIAEFSECFRKFRVVCFLFRMEADVLKQSDIAVLHMIDDFFRHVANRLLAENDRLMDKRIQIFANGTKRIFFDALSFRPAKVRH